MPRPNSLYVMWNAVLLYLQLPCEDRVPGVELGDKLCNQMRPKICVVQAERPDLLQWRSPIILVEKRKNKKVKKLLVKRVGGLCRHRKVKAKPSHTSTQIRQPPRYPKHKISRNHTLYWDKSLSSSSVASCRNSLQSAKSFMHFPIDK